MEEKEAGKKRKAEDEIDGERSKKLQNLSLCDDLVNEISQQFKLLTIKGHLNKTKKKVSIRKKSKKRVHSLITGLSNSTLGGRSPLTNLGVLFARRNPPSGIFVNIESTSQARFFRLREGIQPHFTCIDDDISPYFGGTPITLHHSCNGLILLSTFEEDDPSSNNIFIVFNPMSNLFDTILAPFKIRENPLIHIVYQPPRSEFYELVLMIDGDGDEDEDEDEDDDIYRYDVFVYSSKNEEWVRNSKSFIPNGTFRCSGVCVNRRLHWIGYNYKSFASFKVISFACFDIDNGERLEMPRVPRRWIETIKESEVMIGDANGELLLVKFNLRNEIEICKIKMDYSGWVSMSIVSTQPIWNISMVNNDDCFLGIIAYEGELALAFYIGHRVLLQVPSTGTVRLLDDNYTSVPSNIGLGNFRFIVYHNCAELVKKEKNENCRSFIWNNK